MLVALLTTATSRLEPMRVRKDSASYVIHLLVVCVYRTALGLSYFFVSVTEQN
jgi:predicted permease